MNKLKKKAMIIQFFWRLIGWKYFVSLVRCNTYSRILILL